MLSFPILNNFVDLVIVVVRFLLADYASLPADISALNAGLLWREVSTALYTSVVSSVKGGVGSSSLAGLRCLHFENHATHRFCIGASVYQNFLSMLPTPEETFMLSVLLLSTVRYFPSIYVRCG